MPHQRRLRIRLLLEPLVNSAPGSPARARKSLPGSTIPTSRPRNELPVGAENPVMSCDLDILVDEAAESGSSQWPDDRCGSWSSGALGWALLK
jgi:hypothetical protein